MKEFNNKERTHLHASLIDLLWSNPNYLSEINKIKYKGASEPSFPKMDQWVTPDGLNLNFALAGYAAEDISLVVAENYIEISSFGIKKILEDEEDLLEAPIELFDSPSDEFLEKRRKAPELKTGVIARGIARRAFSVKFYINKAFYPGKITAEMSNGLLEILIPYSEVMEPKQIIVKGK